MAIQLTDVFITLKQIRSKRNRKRRLRQARITRLKKARSEGLKSHLVRYYNSYRPDGTLDGFYS